MTEPTVAVVAAGVAMSSGAKARALMTLFTRVVVMTLILWIGQGLFGSISGRKG
jgi:hypothetical protein